MIQGGGITLGTPDPGATTAGPDQWTHPAELRPWPPTQLQAMTAIRMVAPPATPSNSTQFRSKTTTAPLSMACTCRFFGQVIQGLDVIDKIMKLLKDVRPPTEAKVFSEEVEKLSGKKSSSSTTTNTVGNRKRAVARRKIENYHRFNGLPWAKS
jgi:cyclophilin family peptidyl-prolyl cis-trans isomerase